MTIYQKQKQNKKTNFINLRIISRILVFLIIIQGVYYIASNNDLIIKGFRLHELKTSSNSLVNINRNFNIEITALKSYSSLIKRVDSLHMVAANNVNYIKVNKGELAAK